ncbi:hypothetical protein [Vibrio sp. TBV020]|uniref:hypothetical protein n=1 Tax=Vibrio sp. TBV020 TaxID=3137398 RepID=UPI0038CDB21A
MANYDFINLDVKRKDPLITHLKDVCGIEPDGSASINDLQDAILAFEENNGYERPMSLLPERLKPQDPIVPAQTGAKEPVYKPVSAHPRRKVIVQNSLTDSPQEYFQINEYKILVKFEEEIELPEPMIKHIKDVKVTTYKQEKDGSITPIIRRCYAVSEV